MSDPEDRRETLAGHPDHFLSLSKLHIASCYGLPAIIRRLLQAYRDLISKSNWSAAQAEWKEIVSELIEANAGPSAEVDKRKTSFMYAGERGHTEIISILKKHSAHSDHNQQTLEKTLCDAAEAGEMNIVDKFLQFGVNPDTKKPDSSAMAVKSRREHEQVVRLLLKTNRRPSYEDSLPKESIPLYQAIKNSHVDIAKLLLDFEANIQAYENLGRTALFETLDAPDIRGAVLLLKNDIDMSCRATSIKTTFCMKLRG